MIRVGIISDHLVTIFVNLNSTELGDWFVSPVAAATAAVAALLCYGEFEFELIGCVCGNKQNGVRSLGFGITIFSLPVDLALCFSSLFCFNFFDSL